MTNSTNFREPSILERIVAQRRKDVEELKIELGLPTDDFINESGNKILIYKNDEIRGIAYAEVCPLNNKVLRLLKLPNSDRIVPVSSLFLKSR